MVKHVDSGGQVHLVTNIRKPRKWRRYEYLLSSGTLWIDTGIKLSLTDKFEFETDFTYSASSSTPYPFYGTDSYTTGFMAQYHYINNLLYPLYILGANIGAGSISITAGSRMYSKTIIDVPNKTWAWTYNNTSSSGTYSNQITDTTSTVNIYRSAAYSPYPAKCYYFKIKRNDVLIRHFVPAQYNGQYGMWDLVEDKFYKNAGTGSFTVGPEMKNYDEIYEVRKTSSLLPAGVELYDYIESNGNQWMDTGVKFNAETDSCTVIFKGNEDHSGLIFASLGGKYFWLYYYSYNGIRVYANNGSGLETTSNYLPRDTEKHTMKWENKHYIIDDIDKGAFSKTYTETTNNIWLFSWGGGRGNFPFKGRIYYTNIKHNNQLIRNFLPCTYLGEPGMWDTVENKFYRNQGTGQFTLGNKITFKEYEYLLTNATSLYINTGISVDSSSSVAYDMVFKYEANSVRRLMGPNTSGGNYFGANTNNKYDKRYTNVSVGNIDHIYEEFNGVTGTITSKINGVTYTGSFSTRSGSLLIFALSSGFNGAGQYFYSGKILKNNLVVRDFIPVSYNGTPGLWDKVEWKFYGNAGSGSFTLGPEKKSGIYPVSYLHDRTIYEEPDGSKWLRIVHHNNPSVRRFNLSDSFTTYVHTSEDLWFDASWCNTLTSWELMVKQKPTSSSAEQKYRWVQNVNPMIATFSNTKRANVTYNTNSGYTTPASSYGGLYRVASERNYLNGNNNVEGNWWGSIGNCSIFNGGLPGWNELVITTGYEDLYVRIA